VDNNCVTDSNDNSLDVTATLDAAFPAEIKKVHNRNSIKVIYRETSGSTKLKEFVWTGSNPKMLVTQDLLPLPVPAPGVTGKKDYFLGSNWIGDTNVFLGKKSQFKYSILSATVAKRTNKRYQTYNPIPTGDGFTIDPETGLLTFSGEVKNQTRYKLNLKLCQRLNPENCVTKEAFVPTNGKMRIDKKIFAAANLKIPTDFSANTIGGSNFKIIDFPKFVESEEEDANGDITVVQKQMLPGVTGAGFEVHENGTPFKMTITPATRILVAVFGSGNPHVERILAGETYQIVYNGTPDGSGSQSFNLRIYDSSGVLLSDEAYSMPISGTMASLGMDSTWISNSNDKTVSEEKSATTLIIITGATLFAVNWLLGYLILTILWCKQKDEGDEHKMVKFNKFTCGKWACF
jgi:hypothetical protein